MNHSAYELRDDVTIEESETETTYIFPYSDELAQDMFRAIYDGMWALSSIANEDPSNPYVYAQRRFTRPFKTAYEYQTNEFDPWWVPLISDIYEAFSQEDIPPMTFRVEKDGDKLRYTYSTEFEATNETLTVEYGVDSRSARHAIKECGHGLMETHAPYKPFVTERWRYGPSIASVSIKSVDGQVTVGVKSTPPDEPWWYSMWKPMTVTSSPYAQPTFNLTNQTSTVKYVYNEALEDSEMPIE